MMMHNPSELKHFNQLGHLIVKLERTFLMSSNTFDSEAVGRLTNVRFYLTVKCPLFCYAKKSQLFQMDGIPQRVGEAGASDKGLGAGYDS